MATTTLVNFSQLLSKLMKTSPEMLHFNYFSDRLRRVVCKPQELDLETAIAIP